MAFSCSTEFIPELNEKLRLVPFTGEFKLVMTVLMIVDYAGCYVVEKVLKQLYSDYRPKDIAVRRPDQIKAEEKRKAAEKRAEETKRAQEALEKLEEDKKYPGRMVA